MVYNFAFDFRDDTRLREADQQPRRILEEIDRERSSRQHLFWLIKNGEQEMLWLY